MDFLEVLNRNNEEEIKSYLLQNGKSPKPRAPFYFIKKEAINNGRDETVNGTINEADTRSNC
jgi:hypothetical protein